MAAWVCRFIKPGIMRQPEASSSSLASISFTKSEEFPTATMPSPATATAPFSKISLPSLKVRTKSPEMSRSASVLFISSFVIAHFSLQIAHLSSHISHLIFSIPNPQSAIRNLPAAYCFIFLAMARTSAITRSTSRVSNSRFRITTRPLMIFRVTSAAEAA